MQIYRKIWFNCLTLNNYFSFKKTTRKKMMKKFHMNCGKKPVGLSSIRISMKKVWCDNSLTVSMNLFRLVQNTHIEDKCWSHRKIASVVLEHSFEYSWYFVLHLFCVAFSHCMNAFSTKAIPHIYDIRSGNFY